MDQSLVVPPPHEGPSLPYPEQVDYARQTLPDNLPVDPRKVMVALDVDGTLLTVDGASENVRRTVTDAIEAGINVVIATGRGMASTRPVFTELDLGNGLSVSSNGAQTLQWERTQDGRHVAHTLSEVFFDPALAATELLQVLPEVVLASDDGRGLMRVSQYFPPGELAAREDLTSVEELISLPTIRMVARAPWLARSEFEETLTRADLSSVECAIGWTSWADLTALGTTKAQGLSNLAVKLGVDPQGTIAIGDGDNDIAMLQWAAHGVAMGSASAQVMASANAVTGAVDHDGAAAVLDALLERY